GRLPGLPQAGGRSRDARNSGRVRVDEVPAGRPGLGAHAGRQGAHRQALQRYAGARCTEVRRPMTTDRIDETASRSPPAARFGARLAGVPFAMPVGTSMGFVAAAAIYPLPLAPGRVAGLMQLRGQPLVVLDPATIPDAQGVIRRHDVLVVGQPPQAAALLVDAPPEPLPEGRWRAARGAPPDCAFAAALQDAPLD